jgi:hypothetical protein
VAVQDPKAIGMVLAMLVDPAGKTVRGSSLMGQLHVSTAAMTVVRQRTSAALLGRASQALLVGSVIAVIVNLFTWKSGAILWAAVAAQGLYWLLLPTRRRSLEPEPLSGAALEEARSAGRVVIHVPAAEIVRVVPPEKPEKGFRKPARFELPAGALEIYLSEEQFRSAAAALGRDG